VSWRRTRWRRSRSPRCSSSCPHCRPSRHVIALYAAFEDADAIHLVLDLCVGGDLLSLVSMLGGPLPEPVSADLAAQLADRSGALGAGGAGG
jgi:hypothetical protein